MKYFIAVVALVALVSPTQAYYQHHGGYYHSTDGSMVHAPYHTHRHLREEMAVCRDGAHSVSHHHRGTCSHHHGVAHWG